MGSAFIEYFGRDLLIVEGMQDSFRVFPKGALTILDLSQWKFSWNGTEEEVLPNDGIVSLPKLFSTNAKLHLTNPSFEPIVVEVKANPAFVWFLRLRRKSVENVKIFSLNSGNFRETAKNNRECLQIHLRNLLAKKGKISDETEIRELSRKQPEFNSMENAYPQGYSSVAEEKQAEEVKNPPKYHGSSVKIDGVVLDARNHKPLSGATVLIGNMQSTLTGDDGSFAFHGTLGRLIEVSVYLDGYCSISLKHRVGFRSGSLTLSLKPSLTRFEGLVADSLTGKAIKGAKLSILEKEILSDGYGCFAVKGISPNWYQVSCRAPGYMDAVEVLYVKSPQTRKTILLQPLEGGGITEESAKDEPDSEEDLGS
ncbi:hypothetical protein HYY75_04365 [bacterium]|nr:hypothetical protein [bacterium]